MMRMTQIGANHNVIEHSHFVKGGGYLEGASDAAAGVRLGWRRSHILSGEKNFTACGRGIACKAVKKCRLARAVWGGQTNYLALIIAEVFLAHAEETANWLRRR